MKRVATVVLFILTLSFSARPLVANAQSFEVMRLLLDIEKLDALKKILQEMYDGYRLIEKGYTTVRDISHGNFDLHRVFLDGLLLVSPEVRNYYKVAEITACQLKIVAEYKAALKKFRSGGHFTTQELAYIERVYNNLFDGSLKTLTSLVTVLTEGEIRASDNERMEQIDRLHKAMLSRLTFLRKFNNSTALLGLQRARNEADRGTIKKLYGLE